MIAQAVPTHGEIEKFRAAITISVTMTNSWPHMLSPLRWGKCGSPGTVPVPRAVALMRSGLLGAPSAWNVAGGGVTQWRFPSVPLAVMRSAANNTLRWLAPVDAPNAVREEMRQAIMEGCQRARVSAARWRYADELAAARSACEAAANGEAKLFAAESALASTLRRRAGLGQSDAAGWLYPVGFSQSHYAGEADIEGLFDQ